MTDFTHHTPRLLSDADAAADLAGVPRPGDLPSVGTEDARALAAMLIVHAGDHKDVAYECDMNPVHTLNWKHYETNLSASKALLNLVSERDALAGRVAELEANALRYEWLRAQFWKDNTLGVVLRPADNTKLGCFLPFGKLLDDAIDHMSAAAPEQPKNSPAQGKSLLRPAGSKPTMCYCPPGVCQAPKPSWCIGNRECDAALSTTPESKP